jgi:phosphate/sulfate permease
LNRLNLNNMEQIITLYLIFNFIIAICLLYLILSVIFRIVFKKNNNSKKPNKKKKDIIELFWEEDKKSKSKTIIKRIFLFALILITSIYLFNSICFIINNIEVIKRVLRIE